MSTVVKPEALLAAADALDEARASSAARRKELIASRLREAAATELSDRQALVSAAVQKSIPQFSGFIDAMYADRAIVAMRGRRYAYPYTIGDDNQVTLGTPYEVVAADVPVSTVSAAGSAMLTEAVRNTPESGRASQVQAPQQPVDGGSRRPAGDIFIEALAAADKPARYLVRVIRAGTSINGTTYPASVLREAAAAFNGVRVFAKSDDEHIRGAGKDFRQLVGRLIDAKFVEAGGGEIDATLDVLETSDVADKLREAVDRGMTDLFGLSIDAHGKVKRSGKLREALSIDKVASVDLIIDPSAGGRVIRFTEAVSTTEDNAMLREQMIEAISARDAKRAADLKDATDEQVLAAYREAVQPAPAPAAAATPATVTAADVQEQIRMVEARADARVKIAAAKLPAAVKERLTARFAEATAFQAADVDAAIKGEREFLAKLSDGAQVTGLGEFIETTEDHADKVAKMLDDFFDPKQRPMSFREAYIEVTGDRGVTGLLQNCDAGRLREAAGADFREAVSSSTFSNILGDSITRAMIAAYGANAFYNDWQWLADVVPVRDFRTQERTRLGGYGNLPDVAENGAYNALSSPGDEAASYAISKRGGIETISIETIANDDVGLIRRIPQALATAAARTLYEFVYSFLISNGDVYDTKALFVADHNNLGTTALDADSYAAARLAIAKQTELTSGKRLGLAARHLAVPPDLERTAYDLFVRNTNNDPNFVQSVAPTVHVIAHATDANDWFATADKSQCPLLELGFYNGNEQPELFVQDQPAQGSLFSNDQIKYKIRHIYGATVKDFRGFYGAIVA